MLAASLDVGLRVRQRVALTLVNVLLRDVALISLIEVVARSVARQNHLSVVHAWISRILTLIDKYLRCVHHYGTDTCLPLHTLVSVRLVVAFIEAGQVRTYVDLTATTGLAARRHR